MGWAVKLLAILDIDAVHWKVVEGKPSKKKNMAETDFETNTITIQPDLPLDRYMVSVWHEITHVIIAQRLGMTLLGEDMDEAVAAAMGQGLHQLIENNHHVYRMEEWR